LWLKNLGKLQNFTRHLIPTELRWTLKPSFPRCIKKQIQQKTSAMFEIGKIGTFLDKIDKKNQE